MMTLDLIRHAKTQWNLEKKLQGRKDIPLCPQGIKEARNWARHLQLEKYDVIVSSPMVRAKETAQIISDILKLDVRIDNDLREQDFGQWEGKKIQDIRKESPGLVEKQESKGWAFCPPDGESRQKVLDRALQAIQRIGEQYEEQHQLVVTHSSVIKILVYQILGRQFLPGEKPGHKSILKPYHVHKIGLDNQVSIEMLNAVKLL